MRNKLYKISAFIISLLYVTSLRHGDLTVIITWGKILSDCIANGTVRDFAHICSETFFPCNYNIFVNIISALWCLPVYIIDKITSFSIDMAIYVIWYKVLLLIVMLYSCKYLKKLTKLYNFDESYVEWSSFVYIINGGILLGSIGMGQIDCIANLFLILAIYYLKINNHTRMSLSISIVLLVKGVAIIFYMPILLLLYSNDISKMFKSISITVIPLCLTKIITTFYVVDYDLISRTSEQQWNHLGFFFSHKLGNVPVFLSVYIFICLICISKCRNKHVNDLDYLIFPFIIFATFICFNSWQPQWYLYGLCFVILCSSLLNNQDEANMILMFLSTSFWIFIVTNSSQNVDSIMIKGSLIDFFANNEWSNVHIMGYIENSFPNYAPNVPLFAKSIMAGTFGYMVYKLISIEKKGCIENISNPKCTYWSTFFLSLQYCFAIAFLAFTYCAYFKIIK